MSVHFSSASDQWATPQMLFDEWHALFRFDLDVCADASNAKCARYFTAEDDGLSKEWAPSRCWMNPPYGRTIGRWVQKAAEESQRGALVCGLLPARTDTAWWHAHVLPHAHVVYLRGRVKFGDATAGAPFPSAVAIWSRTLCK